MAYGTVSAWLLVCLHCSTAQEEDTENRHHCGYRVYLGKKGLVIHRVKSLARVCKSSFWQRGRVSCVLAVHVLDTCIQGFYPAGTPGNVQMSTSWRSKQDYCLAHRTANHLRPDFRKDLKDSLHDHFKNRLLKIQAALAYRCAKKMYTFVFFLMNIHFYIPFVRFMIALWFELPSP